MSGEGCAARGCEKHVRNNNTYLGKKETKKKRKKNFVRIFLCRPDGTAKRHSQSSGVFERNTWPSSDAVPRETRRGLRILFVSFALGWSSREKWICKRLPQTVTPSRLWIHTTVARGMTKSHPTANHFPHHAFYLPLNMCCTKHHTHTHTQVCPFERRLSARTGPVTGSKDSYFYLFICSIAIPMYQSISVCQLKRKLKQKCH